MKTVIWTLKAMVITYVFTFLGTIAVGYFLNFGIFDHSVYTGHVYTVEELDTPSQTSQPVEQEKPVTRELDFI